MYSTGNFMVKLLTKSILTFCILMDFPLHMDNISMGLAIVYFEGLQVEISIA